MSASVSFEVDAQWERAGLCWERAARECEGGERVEVYLRSSRRVRVRLPRIGPAAEEHGLDEGLAVRIHRPASREIGFAASSGIGPAIAAWAGRSALGAARPGGQVAWIENPTVRRDVRPVSREGSEPRALAAWLHGVVDRADTTPSEEPWIERSDTIEAVRNGAGGWIRARRRVWGIGLTPAVLVDGAEPIPRAVAGSEVSALPTDPWSAARHPGGHGRPLALEPTEWEVVFDGDSLAALIPALVEALSTGPGEISMPVGRGWVVSDDPLHPASLVGGEWDDAGFPSSRRLLADGGRLVDRLDGPGCLRRGSFRDPPEPSPSFLVVEPPPVPMPRLALRVLALRVLVLSGTWVLDIDGLALREGQSVGAFRGERIRTTPEALVACCAGGIGTALPRAGCVLSPAVCFERLRVEG